MEKIGLRSLVRASFTAMKIFRTLGWVLLAGALQVGCGKPVVPAPTSAPRSDIDPIRGHLLHAQPKLPTVKVWLGQEEMITEVAIAPVEIATGMMYRTNMLEKEAMIFVFSDREIGPKNFYMRNCVLPLSAAYITPDGTIAEIIDLQPGEERGVQSQSSNLQFVLEVPQGWFTRHNVRTGMVVRTERGSLRETFIRR
jgi:uncharacterized membrane protein (UPF0127 family)